MDFLVIVFYGSIICGVDDKENFMVFGIYLKFLDGKSWDLIKILINDFVLNINRLN